MRAQGTLKKDNNARLMAIRRRYERPTIHSVERNRWRALTAATALTDLAALTGSLGIVATVPFQRITAGGPTGLWKALWVAAWWLGLALMGAYDRHRNENSAEEVRNLAQGVTLGAALALVASFSADLSLSRGWALVSWFTGLVTVLIGRRIIRKVVHVLRRHGRLHRRVLIVGSDETAMELAEAANRAPWEGLDVIGFVAAESIRRGPIPPDAVVGVMEQLRELVLVLRVDEVLVAPSVVGAQRLPEIVTELEGVPVELRVAPGLAGFLPQRLEVHPLGDRPLLSIGRIELKPAAKAAKRAMDLAIGTLLLVIASPVIAICAAAVRIDSRGPAFFRQTRIGIGGREIIVWKLRSMVVDAEVRRAELLGRNEAEGLLFKMRDDPRVTRVGAFLRKTSLDELPQLINVVRGTMSLVGPRPPLPDEVAQYDERLVRRLAVKPGITGLWQVSGRHQASFEDYVRFDILYVQNWSIVFDFYILVKTLPAVLLRKGAY